MSETAPNITLNVEGMTCSSCAMSVTNTLKREGCENVDVNFALEEAQFNMPPSADLRSIQKNIEGLGYTTSLAGGKVTSKVGGRPLKKSSLRHGLSPFRFSCTCFFRQIRSCRTPFCNWCCACRCTLLDCGILEEVP